MPPASRRLALVSLLSASLVAPFLATAQQPAEPSAPATAAVTPDAAAATKVVESLHDEMLAVMKDGKALGFDGRLARLQKAIEDRYDFAFMAEKSVGLAWKDIDEAQRAQLVDAMGRLAGNTYAGRMKDFSGEKFETLGTQPAAQATMLVRTQILEPTGKKTSLDYRLRETPAGPKIVDVFYDGTVSELAMRRSEYSSLLKKGGFPLLMDAIEKKIAEQRTSGAES